MVTDGMLTVAEAARMLNRTPKSVRKGLRQGEFRGARLGEDGVWRLPRELVERLARKGRRDSDAGNFDT